MPKFGTAFEDVTVVVKSISLLVTENKRKATLAVSGEYTQLTEVGGPKVWACFTYSSEHSKLEFLPDARIMVTLTEAERKELATEVRRKTKKALKEILWRVKLADMIENVI